MSTSELSAYRVEAMFRQLDGTPIPLRFEGALENGRFRLHRVLTIRNSFAPELFGVLTERPSGTEVRVFARPNWLVTIFMLVWLTGVASFVASLPDAFQNDVLGPLMLVFGVVLYFGLFIPVAIKDRRALTALLAAENVSGSPAT